MKNVDYLKLAAELEFNQKIRERKPFKWLSQTVLFETFMFGKSYFWMQDVDGKIYLTKSDANGLPSLS